MSHVNNEKWLEAAWESFIEATESGNLSLARDIIGDTYDEGFKEQAHSMNAFLLNTPITKFSNPSPYQHE